MPALIGMSNAAWRRQPTGSGAANHALGLGIELLYTPSISSFLERRASAQIISTPSGLGLYHSSSNVLGGVTFPAMDKIAQSWSGVTCFAFLMPHPSGSNGGIITYPDTNNNFFGFWNLQAEGYPTAFSFRAGNSPNAANCTANTSIVNTLQIVCGTWEPGSNNLKIYRNGVQESATTGGTAFSSSSNQANCIGYYQRSGHRAYPESIFLGCVANRAWTHSEVVEVSKNPWQLFAPAPSRFYLIPTAPVLTIPTLSAPGVTDIGSTSVRPQVTLTY